MPNLGLHIGFALECGQRLGHPVVREHQGSFLLGSTTPDIRRFAGWERERTHFFNLATDPSGVGVEGMLRANPHLRKSERLSRETVAFLLGYMTHLHTDESWIVQVWRRFFGKGSDLARDPMVQVLDRAFQFELDRQERRNVEDLEGAVNSIRHANEGVDIGFIDADLLRQWQEVVIGRVGRDLPWDRFRSMVYRVRADADEEEVDRLLTRVPEMLEKVRSYVDEAEVQSFRESAIQEFVSAATGYLVEGQIR